MAEEERPRPAVTTLDVIMLSPVESYAVLAQLASDPDRAVSRALRRAVDRILTRTRVAEEDKP
jgi:hypothetical protein